jgi:hypothetical protein
MFPPVIRHTFKGDRKVVRVSLYGYDMLGFKKTMAG